MKLIVRWLVVVSFLSGSCMFAGCGTESLPACSDVDWIEGDRALLTGAPTFSRSQITPGGPLFMLVPVNGNTRMVTTRTFDVDRTRVVSSRAETPGAETVSLPLEDTTDLPPGTYLATFIGLDGRQPEQQSVGYQSLEVGMPYVLIINVAPELDRMCLTDFFPPTFTVVPE